jgi:hypothetical protein
MTESVAAPQYYDFNDQQLAQITTIETILATTKFANRTSIYVHKKSTGYGQSEAFGFIRRRNRCPGPGRNNARYPELWKQLQVLGSMMPLQYDAVQVNLNCTCNPHKDEGNEGLSLLVSGGDYTGGELVTSFGNFSAKYRGIIFDGSQILHSNLPFVGTKWSIVFFSVQIPTLKQHFFPEGFRTTFPYYRNRFLEHIPHKDTLYFPNGIVKHKGTDHERRILFI